MVRTPTFENGLKKGAWSAEEDYKLRRFIQQNGHSNWRELPKSAGLARCGKSCRLRWVNYLRPDVKHGNFTNEEADLILKLHAELGNKWSKIAANLPGRTDNEIKNHWHTHLKKRRKQHMEDNASSGDEGNNHQARKTTGNSTHNELPTNNITKEFCETIGLQILESSRPLSPQPSSSTMSEYSSLSSETLHNNRLEINAWSMEGTQGLETTMIHDNIDDWDLSEIYSLSDILSQLDQPSNVVDKCYSCDEDDLLGLDYYESIQFNDEVLFSPHGSFYDENIPAFIELMQDP